MIRTLLLILVYALVITLWNVFLNIGAIKDPAASNGVSNLQRCRAAGYLTLAAVAKCLQAATWLVARGNKLLIREFIQPFLLLTFVS